MNALNKPRKPWIAGVLSPTTAGNGQHIYWSWDKDAFMVRWNRIGARID